MKTIKKIVAILLYLIVVSALLNFDLRQLIEVKQIVIVLIGTLFLYLPSIQWKEKKYFDPQILAESALYASMVQSFLLIFVMLTSTKGFEGLTYRIALNTRPLLYGFCLWIVFGKMDGKNQEKEKHVSQQSEQSEQTDSVSDLEEVGFYDRFLELGLTKRESEIAVLICNGLTNGEIAAEFHISETTVKKHVSNIFAKLELTKREQLRQKVRGKL